MVQLSFGYIHCRTFGSADISKNRKKAQNHRFGVALPDLI